MKVDFFRGDAMYFRFGICKYPKYRAKYRLDIFQGPVLLELGFGVFKIRKALPRKHVVTMIGQ
jgi:hypothetical protein